LESGVQPCLSATLNFLNLLAARVVHSLGCKLTSVRTLGPFAWLPKPLPRHHCAAPSIGLGSPDPPAGRVRLPNRAARYPRVGFAPCRWRRGSLSTPP